MAAVSAPPLSGTTALALRAQALACLKAGRLHAAEKALQVVLASAPGDSEARYLLGVVALQAGNGEAAVALLLPEAKRRGENAEAQYNAATALVLVNRFAEAEQLFRRALDLNPELAPAWNNLGNILKAFGEVDAATLCYERAMALGPEDPVRQSHHLICAHYSSAFSHQQLFSLHRQWAERHAARYYPASRRRPVNPDPDRPLAVGFLSPSFNGQIVGHFLRGVLPELPRHGLRLLGYSATREVDAMTAELRDSFDSWREVAELDDDALARTIEADAVDILVDLAGHAPGHRLLVFARRPAPVQITWLDYFDTTGLATMDYLVTDPRTTPPSSPQLFSERLLYLPETRLCWAPPEFAPPVAPAPCAARGHVTFGSFNRADKLNPEILACWAEILSRVPRSRLVMKGRAFGMAEVRRHFAEQFARLGVSSERIDWLGPSTHAALLADYAAVDIALDTTPYNGGATTCDALWMGVPVVALRGERMIARQSAAMLDCLGQGSLAADSMPMYADMAVALAKDQARLATMRGQLRPMMAASALCDGPRFARDLAAALRSAWRECCETTFCNQGG